MQKRKISNFIITMMSLNLLAGISYADENSLESLNTSDKKVYSDYNIDSNVPSRAASGLKTFYVKGAAYQNQTGAFLSSGRAFGFTINCRKAPFFRYGDIRQGFIKNVRKLVAN